MLYERFVMLLKSRSRAHHPHMHYSYTRGRHKNMPFHLDPLENILLLHWEKTPKIYPIGYSPNKCSKVHVAISQRILLQKRGMWL
jgi:hypothetical protein